ncbi:MAG: hypothetical protein RLZZ127_175 [Planctomycetota bacterium]|jgi:hypothetical protein
MSRLTDFAENKLVDALLRAQALGAPATFHVGLIVASRGRSNNVRSTSVSVGDTIIPATPNGRIYRCTTGGTTGASEPTWPTTDNGTVNDGTAVWTEATAFLDAGTITEAAGGSYARVAVTSSLANWAGTQGAGTTVASTGTGGQTSNNAAITYPAPTANWGTVFGFVLYDASSGGNAWLTAPLTTPQDVLNGQAAPSFAVAALTVTFG